MAVALAGREIGLVEVIGPDRVEGGDVARHAGHEGSQQRGERQTKQARGAILFHEREDHAVVIVIFDREIDTLFDVGISQLGGGVGGD